MMTFYVPFLLRSPNKGEEMISRDKLQSVIQAAIEVCSFVWRDKMCNSIGCIHAIVGMADLKTTTTLDVSSSFLLFRKHCRGEKFRTPAV